MISMKRMERIINWLCKRAKLPEYSMLRRYCPVSYVAKLEDRPGLVYVWLLRPGVNDVKYLTRMGQQLSAAGCNPKATHIFTSEARGITKLPADRVRALLEHYYSDDAREGGR
jgi:hypothetical protein